MWLCKYDLSKECDGKYKDCTDCILDKIRAEIEQNAYPIVHGVNNHEKGMTLYGILQVIDKYKADKEGDKVIGNLCDSCANKGCIFQSGIVRNHCDFYKAESEVQDADNN